MGIIERKEREKEDLRKRILMAAKEVFLEKGYMNTSIRNIADRIEYSPTTIYLYFKDKDAIFHALHLEGFYLLNNDMRVLQHVEDPFERLIAMGRIYIDFAMKNYDLYDLMFLEKAPIDFIEADDLCWDEGQSAFNNLQSTIRDCMEKGYFKFENVEVASFVIWSTLHGMCALKTRSRCKVISDENRADIVEKGFAGFSKMLRSIKT
ncbi:TetR family transcriptional regulator [Adhaeribacter arboris]|uniref:TetR family transcriptional regulator n=1 Tax=Adhaeribacter arboris TaxID=2072846 RepID=A0A2T2YHU8_9BACT|nr:TetR/AcrR family transcriptional regulator [Adhaeribacter arboris]PSR55085.1 TetR family transcriptional regulator [Adhaeribacter arboris]